MCLKLQTETTITLQDLLHWPGAPNLVHVSLITANDLISNLTKLQQMYF